MNKKATIIKLILFVSAALCFAFGLHFAEKSAAVTMTIEYNGAPLNEYYALGETFVCPEATINVGGESIRAKNQALYYPDGSAFSDSKYVLSRPGKYRLRYFAEHNGKTVFVEDVFTVKGETYGVSGTTSSVFYGNTGAEKGNIEGLIVSLAPGDAFTYNKPLDLNGKKKGEDIIKFYVVPERKGVSDVKSVKIRLTDVADENNYIEAVVFANITDENEYKGYALYSGVRASVHDGYSGSHYKGYNQSGVIYDGNYYSIYKDISYAAEGGYPSFAASLAASHGYGDIGGERFSKPFSYSIDYAEKKFYGYAHGDGEGWPSNNLVADLDDSLFFDVPWQGFTTGEAYLSVYSDLYVNSSFTFAVLGIFDEDLTETRYRYDKEPVIKVDFPEGEIPYAIEGAPYRVFDAKAYAGCDGVIPCVSLVYRDYYSNSGKLCAVNGGAFVPEDRDAVYTIVYTAEDSYGNRAEKTVDISVRATREASLSLEDGVTSAYTGEAVTLRKPVFSSMNGNYDMAVSAILNGKETPVEVCGGEYLFYTLEAGAYEIKYTLTDYNGPIVESYVLNVFENPYPVFYGEPILPCAFVNGAAYEFPVQYGKSFSGGKVNDLTASLGYSFDNGAETPYGGGKVTVTARNSVKLIYMLSGTAEKKIYEIPVTDVGLSERKYYREKYFYSEQFTGTASPEGVVFSTSEETAAMNYVKPVMVVDFGFDYEFLTEDFSSVTFTLKDTVNASNALTVVMVKKSREKFTVSVNGGEYREITSAVLGKTHTIQYSCVLNELKIDGFSFSTEGMGDFAKKNAYFGIEVAGNTGVFKMNAEKLNKQLLDNQTSDYAAPLYYLDINDGKKTKGDKITINGYFVEDILRFTQMGTVTVIGPDGNVCVTTDGVSMNKISDFSRVYEINVNEYGAYSVTAEYSDGANKQRSTIQINSYDFTPPVVTVSETDKYSAVYAGYTYKIAKASAADNLGENVKVITVVIDTEGKTHIVTDEFAFTRAGVYRVMYYAEDSFGNVGFAGYDIIAVEKEGR